MRLAGPEDHDKIRQILEDAAKSGETMVKGQIAPWFDQGFFLLDDHGVFWCKPLDDRTLEVHTTFEKGYRGKYVLDSAREAQRMLFSELGIERMVTKCKTHHKYVITFSQWIGFHRTAQIGDDVILECPIESYIYMDKDLAENARVIDFPLPGDSSLEQAQFAGFFALCCQKGLVVKGLKTYNRIALLLQWQPLILTSANPILVSVDGKEFSPTSVPTEV